MSRWPDDARERLEAAAFELFATQGYDETTVAQIAERAGLNRATFFRQFADKREVVFGGEDRVSETLTDGIRLAAPGSSVMERLQSAFVNADAVLTPEQRLKSAQRVAALATSVEVQERGLLKRSRMSASVCQAFLAAGFDDFDARLGAEIGMLTFSMAMERWLRAGSTGTRFSKIAIETLRELEKRVPMLRDEVRAAL
jgi:AcrR family transcriptional regulator